jgi:hypothetical protein
MSKRDLYRSVKRMVNSMTDEELHCLDSALTGKDLSHLPAEESKLRIFHRLEGMDGAELGCIWNPFDIYPDEKMTADVAARIKSSLDSLRLGRWREAEADRIHGMGVWHERNRARDM